VGFHTFDYARHFLSACKRLLDLDFETLPGGMMGVNCSGHSHISSHVLISEIGRFVSILTSHVGIPSEDFQVLWFSCFILVLLLVHFCSYFKSIKKA
jgi:trehalose-6-phosphate synthase